MSCTYALVGGNSGIGLALARRLVAAGHTVHAAARTAGPLAELGVHVQPFDAESPGALVWPERLDGFVYCPGTITLKSFGRLTADDFLRDLRVNLLGAVAALQSAHPALRASGSGSVVLFSTIAVAQGMPMHASIAAAKGAVEGLARSLAAEWAPHVRVNVIAPSLSDTPLAGALLADDARRAGAAKRHPLQRVGDADQLAATAEHLLGPASGFMTGQVLRIDGGLSSVRLL